MRVSISFMFKSSFWVVFAVGGFLAMTPSVWGQSILIHEIMYHPPGANPREQWIEIFNPGARPVDLSGWRFSQGVDFTFRENTLLSSRAYLVIAADRSSFTARYPEAANFVADWQGSLSWSGEEIRLVDAQGRLVDRVVYASEGDWAVRQLGALDGLNRQGWEWFAAHKGLGSSLELVNPQLSNDSGQNWAASALPGGTPGQANSMALTNTAPLVLEAAHFPLVPKSSNSVTIVARLVDESLEGLSATLFWRLDGTNNFTAVSMRDDGAHGDGLAGDGVFGAVLDPIPDRTLIEFYVSARDREGHERIYPKVVPSGSDRTANLAYQVDDSAYTGAQPVFRLIMTQAEYAYLANQIWGGQPRSDAEVNGTFISTDPTSDSGPFNQCRYFCGFRNRGHGSRITVPHNFHVSFAGDRPWKGRRGLNLNTVSTHSQHLGSALFRRLLVPMPDSRPVQVRVNALNLAQPGQPQFGSYAANEVVNDEFVRDQFPLDAEGNLYRGVRDMIPGNYASASLVWLGADYASYTNAYAKENHAILNDWSDLIRLLDALNNTPEADYAETVRRVVNVEQWMRYFAINTLLDNQENSLANGAGDDFILYRGAQDPRFLLLPYDLDSLMGRGTRATSYADGLWRMTSLAAINRFMKHPDFVPLYFKHLKQLAETSFAPARMNPWLDHLLSDYVDAPVIATMKEFNSNHVAYVTSQIPLRLTVSHALSWLGGYPYTTSSIVALQGAGPGIETRAVRVNGAPAVWTAWQGRWTMDQVSLRPGLNRVLIQAMGEGEREVEHAYLTIWYDNGQRRKVSGLLGGDETWSPLEGPYHITADLLVSSNATLTLPAGATLFLEPGVNVTVEQGGRLLAEGTAQAPIVFTSFPGNSLPWGGITIQGGPGSPETRLAYAHIEHNGSTAIHAAGATVFLDHLTFGSTDQPYVSLEHSSFLVSHCLFPTPTASFELIRGTGGIRDGGQGVFLRNYFGAAQGYKDVIDFTGGNRPGAIVHFLDNVFLGSGDDILDLDGTDAWVEGNIFLHCHRNGALDSASAISGGSHNGETSEITIRGNLFYDCDHAVTAKQGNFYVLLNNTIVRQTKEGGLDTDAAVLNLADEGSSEGEGMYWEGNIILEAEKLVRNHTAARLVFTNNLMPFAWAGPGGGNSTAPPLLAHVPPLTETQFASWKAAQIMRQWFSPLPGSPALAAGSNGTPLGGVIPRGASVRGNPVETTSQTGATLWVGEHRAGPEIPLSGWPGGVGFTHYQWRLDGGHWSEAIPSSRPIEISDLSYGAHRVEVVGKMDSGWYQNDPIFGLDEAVVSSVVWTIDTNPVTPVSLPSLRINELLARNSTLLTDPGSTPDLIELHNAGVAPLDLSGMGLTDDANRPYQYVLPAGTSLAPGAYLVLLADPGIDGPYLNTGFGLNQAGDRLFLYDRAAAGGRLLDSVIFGQQLADLSIGRRTDSSWGLCRPTFGAANVAHATGPVHSLKINEWLANARLTSSQDFIELYNPDPLPAPLGGLRLSDASGAPGRHVIAPLSFIEGQGFSVFMADGADHLGADHLNFRLSSEVGLILLSTPELVTIDAVNYSSPPADSSEGRSPSGGDMFARFAYPTPGVANPRTVLGDCRITQVALPLLPMEAVWKYCQTTNLDGLDWTSPDFDDSAWSSGPALLGVESCDCLPAPGLQTDLTLGQRTSYFRTQFVVSTNLDGFQLSITAVVDDGAILYLNGSPILATGMSPGAAGYSIFATRNVGNASKEFFCVSGAGLQAGTNVLAVEVHQANSGSGDLVWGMALDATRSFTNCPSDGSISVALNEVLANRTTLQNGWNSDYIELFNSGLSPVDLSEMSLTDDAGVPRKWTFPPDSILLPQAWRIVQCVPDQPVSAANTGFGLRANGGTVLLFDRPTRGGGLVDALRYGLQTPGFAVARLPDFLGKWNLARPTPGRPNQAVDLGDISSLRINEWMADPALGSDWFEIFNGGSAPVALGGLFLTDQLEHKSQSPIPPLSFLGVGSNAFALFVADGNRDAGADHVSFALRKSGETIGLYTAEGQWLDGLAFGPQQTGVSQGRTPDGAALIESFPGYPSPARSNSAPDSDQDDMLDAWELAVFGTLVRDGRNDFDHDGMSDLEEYLAGTNPADPADRLSILCLKNGDAVVLEFFLKAGKSYTLQSCDALGLDAWSKMLDIQPAAQNVPMSVTDPRPLNQMRYYRLVTPMQP